MIRVDRRAFLKGLAAAYIATQIPGNVYGLSTSDATLMFPPNAMTGYEFHVRLNGRYTIKWPPGVTWRSGAPIASGGTDLIRFISGGDGKWYGSSIQDFR